jgi:hypothetical protein
MPHLSRNGNLTNYPLHHKSVPKIVRRLEVVADRDRKNDNKLFPKSAFYIGTITACPKCGLRGKLTYNFKYDSCNDAEPRQFYICRLRDLSLGKFTVNHWCTKRKNKENPKYLGACFFNESYFDELNALLINGRVIPEVIERYMIKDVYGRGYSLEGKKLWSAK